MGPVDILFLCETNSATSVMAEAILNHMGDVNLRAFSAGAHPVPHVLPEALQILNSRTISTDGLMPKPLSIFTMAGGREPDVIVDLATVTWTDPDIARLARQKVLRWPLRDPVLIADRRDRRVTAEAVFRELQERITREFAAPRRDRIAS